MLKRSLLAVVVLGVSGSAFAMSPANPLDPMYKAPAFKDIHNGDGAMTQEEYMNYVNRSWTESGGKDIDKSHPKYSDYQKSPRFEMMDKNRDGSISQSEYRGFRQDAWAARRVSLCSKMTSTHGIKIPLIRCIVATKRTSSSCSSSGSLSNDLMTRF